MKKIAMVSAFIIALTITYLSASEKILAGPIFVVNKAIPDFTIKDQFGNSHKIDDNVERLIVALDREPAHVLNKYLSAKTSTFLKDKKTLFLADVSVAPAIIRRIFIMPGLKKYKHQILIFTDKKEANPFRMNINSEKILEVSLRKKKITSLKYHEATIEAVQSIF